MRRYWDWRIVWCLLRLVSEGRLRVRRGVVVLKETAGPRSSSGVASGGTGGARTS